MTGTKVYKLGNGMDSSYATIEIIIAKSPMNAKRLLDSTPCFLIKNAARDPANNSHALE